MLNSILYWLNTGIPWRDMPERFGPWQSVYSRFWAWTKAGIWERILSALIEQDLVDETTLMLDSTTVKVHQHASGAKKGIPRRNRSEQGWFNNESPCGNGWAWESNDICIAQALPEPFDLNGKFILADKGYDSDKFVWWLEKRGGIVVIPSRINAKQPRKTDWHTYKERHLVKISSSSSKTTAVLLL